jgi:hypothetical protein
VASLGDAIAVPAVLAVVLLGRQLLRSGLEVPLAWAGLVSMVFSSIVEKQARHLQLATPALVVLALAGVASLRG